MKYVIAAVLIAFASAACTHAPPNLSPRSMQEFNNTRVIKAIDLVRDVAVDANKQTPPLLSQRATKKVVVFHQSAIHVIDAGGAGRQAQLMKLIDELKLDKDLLPAEVAQISPYLDLAKSLIQTIAPPSGVLVLPEVEVV